MVYSNEISLAGFLSSLGWTRPEEHVELILVRRDEDGENGYIDLPCNVYNVAKYAYHKIDNIMIEDHDTFSVMIYEDC
jgi:hypothetical protein